MTDDRQPDLNAAIAFLDAWHGPEPRHLTAIVPDGKATGRSFTAVEREQMSEWCADQQRRGANLYYHVNVLNRSPRHGGKASKSEIRSVRGAHVEIDLKDSAPRLNWRDANEVAGATALVLEQLKDFPTTPTFVVLSGGGVQAGWRFDAPVKLNGGQTTARIETLNLALALHFGGDKGVRDVSRILRLPGTINFPNEKKLKLGRGPSLSSCPILFDNAVSAKTLWLTVPETARTAAEHMLNGGKPKPPPNPSPQQPMNVDPWINGLDQTTLHIVRNETLLEVDRSRMCFQVLLKLIRANVPDEVAVELRRRFANGPFGHYLTDRHLQDDLRRAHQYARTHGFDGGAPQPSVAPDEPAIPAITEPQPGDEFPLEELGPGLAPVARAAARVTGAPAGLAAMTVLTTCSLMTQQHIDVRVFESVRPTSLMALTVALSGERKTTLDDLLLKSVRAYERAEVVRLEQEKQRYRIAQQVFEAQVKAIGRRKLDAAEREKELAGVGAPPTPPPEPGVLIDDATIEGLYRQLRRGRVSQGLISAEGGLFLGGHAMTDDAILRTLAGFSQIWDRGEFNIVRADVERSHHVWGRRFTFGMMAQPEVARRLTGNKLAKDQGTMSRMLVHWPKSTIGTRTQDDLRACETIVVGASDADVIEAVIGHFHDNIQIGLTAPIVVDETGAILCACLRPTDEAIEDLKAFAVAMEQRMQRSKAGRSFNNKAPEHAARIASCLQTYDAIAEHATVVLPKALDATHMRRGIRLAEFFVDEAERLMGHGEVDPETEDAAALERWLLEKRKSIVTMVELARRGPGGLRSVRKLRAATRVLVENGRLRLRKDGADFEGRRRREAWDVVPDDHT